MKSDYELISDFIPTDAYIKLTHDTDDASTYAGLATRQAVALQLAVVDTGLVSSLMLGNATYLRDSASDSGFSALRNFLSDINYMNYSYLLGRGIKNPRLFKDLAAAYFILNHRNRSFDGWATDWQVIVEKVGMHTFFSWVADGHSFADIRNFSDNDIDPMLVRAFAGTTQS